MVCFPIKSGKNRLETLKRSQEGATRTEVVAIILGVLVLIGAGVGFAMRSRTLSETGQCAANLKALGLAMNLYEQANADLLPYAYIRYDGAKARQSKSWDKLIYPYVPPGPRGMVQKHLLRCPEDTIPGKGDQARRTFAMPEHNMKANDWPPGPENHTGIGLWWARGGKAMAALRRIAPDEPAAAATGTNAIISAKVTLPAIKLSMITAPASTLLLTEHAEAANLAFDVSGATIPGPNEHVDKKEINPDQFHGGKINYLMVDGHVELLYPLESIGKQDPKDPNNDKRHPNIWTIRPED